MRFVYAVLFTLLLTLTVSSAYADTIQYTVIPTSGSSTTFTIDSTKYTVASQYDEYTTSAGQSFFLGSSKTGGGFGLQDGNRILFDLIGPQLFTGTFANPTLLTGSFSLRNAFDTTSLFTLSITDLSTATTPEPSSLIFLGTGTLAMFGVGSRRLMSPGQPRKPL